MNKSKVTKYYLAKFEQLHDTRDVVVSGCVVVEATNPDEAYEIAFKQKYEGQRITDIKLIEIVQEDTNQE